MNIAIVGASGFLGSHLTKHLLHNTQYGVRAISLNGHVPNGVHANPRLTTIAASVLDDNEMAVALDGVQVAFYLVHMMGQKNRDFYGQEALAAERFSAACKTANVKRVIYMGGLGNDHEQLSEHLLSRHNTGSLLRTNLPLVIEFRASMIIGNGSVAYDIIRNLVQKLPVMVLPKWSISKTQPIALDDVLDYLSASIDVRIPHSEIIEIGGQDIVSYKELYRKYADWSGHKTVLIRMALIPEWIGGRWLDLFTPKKHARIGRIMVHSLSNSMFVTHPDPALKYFPSISPRSLIAAFEDTQRFEQEQAKSSV